MGPWVWSSSPQSCLGMSNDKCKASQWKNGNECESGVTTGEEDIRNETRSDFLVFSRIIWTIIVSWEEGIAVGHGGLQQRSLFSALFFVPSLICDVIDFWPFLVSAANRCKAIYSLSYSFISLAEYPLLRNFHMKKFSWRKQENPRSVDNTTMLGDSAFGAVQSLELSGVVMVKKFLVKYAENQNKTRQSQLSDLNLSSDIQSWTLTSALSTPRSTGPKSSTLPILLLGSML